MEVCLVLTLEQIEQDLRDRGIEPIEHGATVWWAVHTVWWTTHPEHIWTTAVVHGKRPTRAEREQGQIAGIANPIGGLPCDPRGSVLLQGCAWKFIGAARENPDHYGKHGLRAFAAAHSANTIESLPSPVPWSTDAWAEINAALDRHDAREMKRIQLLAEANGKPWGRA